MKHHALSLVMMSVLLITVGYPQQATTPNAQFTSPISEWEPSFQFDGELYPSFVLTMGGNSRAMRETGRFFGDSLAFTGVTLAQVCANAGAAPIMWMFLEN